MQDLVNRPGARPEGPPPLDDHGRKHDPKVEGHPAGVPLNVRGRRPLDRGVDRLATPNGRPRLSQATLGRAFAVCRNDYDTNTRIRAFNRVMYLL